jgi:hypothetical protein
VNCAMGFGADHQTTLWNGQVIVIGDDLILRGKIVELIKSVGGRITKPLPIDFYQRDIERRLNPVAVVIHICGWDHTTQKSLSSTENFCRQQDLPLLILLSLDLLDFAIGAIDHPNIEFLVTGSAENLSAELLVTLNNSIFRTMSATFENRDEPDLADLKKISADVDRIARVLSRLSREQISGRDRDHVSNPVFEPDIKSTVSDDPFPFKDRNDIAIRPFGNASEQQEIVGVVRSDQIRDVIRARRLRDQYFDADLFADPAWDMLLDLMAARLENKKVSVSSLCIAANVPPTTALRWIKIMTEEEIFRRQADAKDGRRIFIELSDDAAAGMVGFFSVIRRNKLMMI